MEFVKGAMIGMAIGAVVGFNNEELIKDALKQGKRKYKKMMKKYPYSVF